MKKSLIRVVIQNLRKITPLSLRKKIGSLIGYVVYFFNVYIRKNRRTPIVLSINDTINLIKKEKLSVIRFGDGEISLMENYDLAFQKKNQDLAIKLRTILQTNLKGLLICVPDIFKKLNGLTKRSFWFWIRHLFKYEHIWSNLLSYKQTYGNAFITRPYLEFIDKSSCKNIFKKLFSIWEGKDIVLIEGEKSRLGVGNDMFSNVKSLQRILCPPENAFSKYDAIKNEAIKISRDKLILISLGPTAKVLAYDLFLIGYRVIDIGHIDMEYEMFLRKETKLTKVKYKYFNEINERNPEYCDNPQYLSQIIANIK